MQRMAQKCQGLAGRPGEVHKTLLVCGTEHVLAHCPLNIKRLDPTAQFLIYHRYCPAAAVLLLLWLRAGCLPQGLVAGRGRPRKQAAQDAAASAEQHRRLRRGCSALWRLVRVEVDLQSQSKQLWLRPCLAACMLMLRPIPSPPSIQCSGTGRMHLKALATLVADERSTRTGHESSTHFFSNTSTRQS